MKISDILVEEKKDTHCSDKCCGSDTLREDCKCPPDCKGCNCNNPNISEGKLDNFDLTPQQRKIVALGHILKTQAATVKDDALSNAMARVGDELTSYGATFGPKNLKDVAKKSGIGIPVIQKLVKFAQKIESETSNLKKDHNDGGLDDSNDTDDDYGSATKADAFAKSKMSETTSAGSVAAVAAPVGGMVSRQMKNSDGTAKNALDVDANLLGGTAKNKRSKKK